MVHAKRFANFGVYGRVFSMDVGLLERCGRDLQVGLGRSVTGLLYILWKIIKLYIFNPAAAQHIPAGPYMIGNVSVFLFIRVIDG